MSTPRADVMADFEAIVLQLISEVSAYASGGVANDETDGNIRKVRTLAAALNAAVTSVPNFPRPMVPSSAPLSSSASAKS